VAQPTKFDFVINSRTAKVLGVMIPQSRGLRADEVVQYYSFGTGGRSVNEDVMQQRGRW
jgi:hypothetical protein